ncbi:hypothetical protein [Streptomyces sp. NPDC000133]
MRLLITTITHGDADRVRSYELLAEEWHADEPVRTGRGGELLSVY